MNYTGTLKLNETVLFENATVSLHEIKGSQTTRLGGWWGHIEIDGITPEATALMSKNLRSDFTLVLDDGRKGRVGLEMDYNELLSDAPVPKINFQGKGNLK